VTRLRALYRLVRGILTGKAIIVIRAAPVVDTKVEPRSPQKPSKDDKYRWN